MILKNFNNIIFSLENNNNTIKVHNLSNNNVYVRFYYNEDNFTPYPHQTLKKTFFVTVNRGEGIYDYFNKTTYIYIRYKCEMFVFKLSFIDFSPILEQINEYSEFNFDNEITFVTGNGGGGTSIVVKLLRNLGVHFGDDCGDIDIRKPHESSTFKEWVRSTKDLNLSDSKKLLNQVINVYNYKKNKSNCFKIPYGNSKEANIITINNILPNLKVLSVLKKQKSDLQPTTKEGQMFSNSTEVDVLKSQRPLCEGCKMFHLDYYKFFTDYNYVNKVLNFLNHDFEIKTNEEFKSIKDKIEFNEKSLSI